MRRMNLLTPQEYAALDQSCDKHEIRGEQREFVIEYAKLMIFEMTMLRAVFTGLAEITGFDEDGSPRIELTAKGRAAMRAQRGLPKEKTS